MGYPPPYYLRLRIFAKQASYFYHKLRLLEPVYDNCPVRCLAPERDKPNNCPDCSYTLYYKQFRANYYKLLVRDLTRALIDSGIEDQKALTEATKLSRLDWSFEDLQEDYRILSELEAIAGAETEQTPGGYNENWNVRTDLSIAIIREERYKVRREIEYNREQELKARGRNKEGR